MSSWPRVIAPHCSLALYSEEAGKIWTFRPTLAAATSRAMICTISSRGSPWLPGNWWDARSTVSAKLGMLATSRAAATEVRSRAFIGISWIDTSEPQYAIHSYFYYVTENFFLLSELPCPSQVQASVRGRAEQLRLSHHRYGKVNDPTAAPAEDDTWRCTSGIPRPARAGWGRAPWLSGRPRRSAAAGDNGPAAGSGGCGSRTPPRPAREAGRSRRRS